MSAEEESGTLACNGRILPVGSEFAHLRPQAANPK